MPRVQTLIVLFALLAPLSVAVPFGIHQVYPKGTSNKVQFQNFTLYGAVTGHQVFLLRTNSTPYNCTYPPPYSLKTRTPPARVWPRGIVRLNVLTLVPGVYVLCYKNASSDVRVLEFRNSTLLHLRNVTRVRWDRPLPTYNYTWDVYKQKGHHVWYTYQKKLHKMVQTKVVTPFIHKIKTPKVSAMVEVRSHGKAHVPWVQSYSSPVLRWYRFPWVQRKVRLYPNGSIAHMWYNTTTNTTHNTTWYRFPNITFNQTWNYTVRHYHNISYNITYRHEGWNTTYNWTHNTTYVRASNWSHFNVTSDRPRKHIRQYTLYNTTYNLSVVTKNLRTAEDVFRRSYIVRTPWKPLYPTVTVGAGIAPAKSHLCCSGRYYAGNKSYCTLNTTDCEGWPAGDTNDECHFRIFKLTDGSGASIEPTSSVKFVTAGLFQFSFVALKSGYDGSAGVAFEGMALSNQISLFRVHPAVAHYGDSKSECTYNTTTGITQCAVVLHDVYGNAARRCDSNATGVPLCTYINT